MLTRPDSAASGRPGSRPGSRDRGPGPESNTAGQSRAGRSQMASTTEHDVCPQRACADNGPFARRSRPRRCSCPNGEIIAVGRDVLASDAEVIDGRSMIALPGLIDPHNHIWNSPCRNLVMEGPERGYFRTVRALG